MANMTAFSLAVDICNTSSEFPVKDRILDNFSITFYFVQGPAKRLRIWRGHTM